MARHVLSQDEAWAVCQNATMVSRLHADLAYNAVVHADATRLRGAIVEIGVWRGGISCYMAAAHRHQARDVWLLDTYEGLPAPTAKDGARAKNLFNQLGTQAFPFKQHVQDGKWCFSSMDDVQATMARTSYPKDKVHYIKGKVEDTLRNSSVALPERIAILRLDTDFYESTRVELELLWPRLAPGGWLYIDDYMTWGGCHTAVLEWLREHGWEDEARKVGAIPRAHTGRFNLWKSLPYNSSKPFVSPRNPPVVRRA